MIWSDIETATREEIEHLQLMRLKKTVAHLHERVPFYTERLDACGVNAGSLQKLSDLQNIPFTTKEDLRQGYPYKLFAVPMRDIVRLHASSGTTGKPTVVGYTRKDLDMWSDCVARLVVMAGGTADDIAQISFGYGLFTGALGLHMGLDRIGAAVIPISAGNTEKQLMVMKDFGTTLLVSTPSYALYMSDVAKELGYTKDDFSLRLGLFGGEGHSLEMNAELERRWGITATENYGLSEIVGPGVSGECTCKCGLHFNEDCFIPEIIDPQSGEVLPYGELGELVVTTVNKEGFAVLRYRTKDITSLHPEKCACGRTTLRMSKVKGRTDDMLIIKGVNVYPSQVESVIVGLGSKQISPYYQLVVTKKGFVNSLEVQIELIDDSLLDEYSALEQLERSVKGKLHSVLGLDCKVRLREPNSIERTTGKAKRVVFLE